MKLQINEQIATTLLTIVAVGCVVVLAYNLITPTTAIVPASEIQGY